MNFAEWEKRVPDLLREDALWTVRAYRLSLFLADVAWPPDVVRLSKITGVRSLSDQLYRLLDQSARILKKDTRRKSSKDRARFYEYSSGSARETRGWFYRARHILGETVSAHRLSLTTEIIKLLLTMVPEQRNLRLNEELAEYDVEGMLDMDVPFNYGLRS